MERDTPQLENLEKIINELIDINLDGNSGGKMEERGC